MGYTVSYGKDFKKVLMPKARSSIEALEHFLGFVRENEASSGSIFSVEDNIQFKLERVGAEFSPAESKPAPALEKSTSAEPAPKRKKGYARK